MNRAFGIFVLFILIAVPISFAAAEINSSDATTSKGSSVPTKEGPFGVPVCTDESVQIQEEATDLFGFNPGPPIEVTVLHVGDVPFGIVARFADNPFGYGRALPLNEFTHVRAIVVLRKEITHTKMSGIVYNQEVKNPDHELLIGNLFPYAEPSGEDVLESGFWDFLWVDQNKYWTGPYDHKLWENWDCTESDN